MARYPGLTTCRPESNVSALMSVMSLESGIVCSRAKVGARDGVPAFEPCSLAWFDEFAAERGDLVGDTLVISLESSILVEISGGTEVLVGDTVRTGRRSGRFVVSESGDGPDGGYDGVCGRCG